MNKINIISEISNTQRISLELNNDNNGVILQKEFRKDSSQDWKTSKGINIPKSSIPVLVNALITLNE